MITLGLVIFNLSKVEGIFEESMLGVILVLISLMFDGFVSSQQDKNHKTAKRPYAYHTMLYNNTFILLGNLVVFAFSVIRYNDTSI
jgi:hypothetical protein